MIDVPPSETGAGLAALAAVAGQALPGSVRQWLSTGRPAHVFGLPLLGLPIGPTPDNMWGATLLLRTLRPDLPRGLLVLRLLGDRALCIEPGAGGGESRLLEVGLKDAEPPLDLGVTFEAYLRSAEADVLRAEKIHARIERVIAEEGYTYDHAKGGRLPKAHKRRIVRSCVHDMVVGLAVLRQDDRRNETVVELFECTDHPLYEPGHGARSLAGLIFSDAYKAATSMAVRFIAEERGSPAVPPAFASLARSLGVPIQASGGRVSPEEGVALFGALSGLSAGAARRIDEISKGERIGIEAMSFLVISRCWTAEEAEWVLGVAPRPVAVLFGSDGPEDWLAYGESSAYAHAAILGTMFRSSLNEAGDEGVDAAVCVPRGDVLDLELRRSAVLPWDGNRRLAQGHRLTAAVRPRLPAGDEASLILADAERLRRGTADGSEPVLIYSSEMEQVDLGAIRDRIAEIGVRIVAAPYRIPDLEEIYEERLVRARRVRR